jgi:hypothetical protein
MKDKHNETSKFGKYDHFKEYKSTVYTGMKIGRGHTWKYDAGQWKEKKITPDKWQITYSVTKRRKGKAPEGSGVPVGTKYHWYILADQIVEKLNANDYSTEMVGVKYKVSHQRAEKNDWNVTEITQKKRIINFLKEVLSGLEKELTDMQSQNKKVKGKTPKILKDYIPERHKIPKHVRQGSSSI